MRTAMAKLEINLFGSCFVRRSGADSYEITGTKHKALFAILATAPFGRRTRSFLQDALWGASTFDSGRQSLRRAISDIKAVMGPDFDRLLTTTHSEITLDLQQVRFVGRPGSATFLEGLSLTSDMSGRCNKRSVRFYSVSERRRYEPSRSVTGSSTYEVRRCVFAANRRQADARAGRRDTGCIRAHCPALGRSL
ncbi:AfsR/SARP family transcriptional regulator [Tateyamaria sp.]|uniref:AfsR/SARP family transcriptional regulator n=1 Tax=Tateyamaria sp. TaxID=1929288 RepID=UPI003B20FC8C